MAVNMLIELFASTNGIILFNNIMCSDHVLHNSICIAHHKVKKPYNLISIQYVIKIKIKIYSSIPK